tara:strand:- start:289 stop:510 length:222 start_codon:yes stop_codon:yes gene_type:complete
MKKKYDYKKSLKIINQIQRIRSKNNVNWMNLVRLSLKLDSAKTSQILSEIYSLDQKISKKAKELFTLGKIKSN